MITTSDETPGGLNVLEYFQTVEIRHHQVDQQHVEVANQGRLKPGLGIVVGPYVVSVAAEDAFAA